MSRFFKVSIFLCGFMAVILIAAGAYLSSDSFDRQVRQRLTAFLEDRFQTNVSFGKIDISLWQGRIELDDIRLEDKNYPDDKPAIAAQRALVDFSLFRYWLTGIHLDEVRLDRLRLNLKRDPNGRLNLANMFGSQNATPDDGKGFSPVKVAISSVRLDDARVTYEDQQISFSSSSEGFELALSYLPDPPTYSGDIDLRGFSFLADDYPIPVTDFSSHFVVRDNLIRFERAKLQSEQLVGSIDGAILNFKPFEYAFSVNLVADLPRFDEPDLASVFERGKVQLQGQLKGTGSDVDFTGELGSELLQIKGIPLSDVSGSVRAGGEGATLTDANFSIFDGSGNLDAEIYWSADKRSSAQVTATGMRLAPVLALFESGDLPVRAVNRIQADVSWPGVLFTEISGPAELGFSGRLTQGASPEATDLPFTGATHVELSRDGVAFDNGTATTHLTDVAFSGKLSFQGDLELSAEVDSGSGREGWSIADRFGALPADLLARYPLEPDGSIRGHVDLLRPSGGTTTLTATLAADSIRYRGVPLGTTQAQVVLTENSFQVRQLELKQGAWELSGDLDFSREPFQLEAVSAQAEKFPVHLLSEVGLIPGDVDFKGLVSGSARLALGGSDGYSGRARVSLTDAVAFGESLSMVSAQIQAAGKTFRATDISARIWGTELTGQASVDLEDQSFQFRVSGSGLEVGQISAVPANLSADGTFQIQLQGSGTLDNPKIDLSLRSEAITVAAEPFNTVVLQAHYDPESADLKGSARYLGQNLRLQASLDPATRDHFTAALDFPEIDLAPLFDHFLGGTLTDFRGQLAGNVQAEGNLSDLKNASVNGEFTSLQLSASDYQVKSPAPWKLRFKEQRLILENGKLSGPDTNLNLGGFVDLGESQLNLKITGTADLKAANAFLKDGRTAGEVSLEIDVGGALNSPRLVGTADLSQVALTYPGLPTSIRDGKGQIRFTSSQISIESFSAQTRFGSVEVNGGLFVDGLVPTRWQINISGYGLVLEYPEGFNTILDGDVDYLKGEDSELLSGAIYVRSSEYTKDISVAELILSLNEPNGNGSPAGSSKSNIALDLTVEAYHSLRINNNLAEVVASADLSIVGTTANPVILGSLTVDDGKLNLEGNEYEFTRGTVNFSNPRKTTPYLNLELETQVREYNIGIVMRGSIDQFQLSLRSEPPLSTASIVSLLAAGQTEEEIFGVEPGSQSKSSALAAYGAGALLGKTLGTAVGGQASRLFGIDRFSIDPFISDSRSRDPGARITLGKQITKDFNVSYISSLANSFQEQTVIIQYRLTDWVTAVGTSQTDGTVAVDFKFRKRF